MSAPVEIHGTTRAAFLARAVLAAGALAAGPVAQRALALEDDAGVVRFAIVLEELELALWAHGLQLVGLGSGVRAVVEDLRSDEHAHLRALRALPGGRGGTPASFRFGGADEAGFLQTAAVVEDLVVGGYNAAVGRARTTSLVETLAAIASVEGRHAAAMRVGASLPPAPFAKDPARGASEVGDVLMAWRAPG